MSAPPQTSYKGFPCKGCGAGLEYAPGTTSLRCPYCGADNPIEVQRTAAVEHGLQELEVKASNQARGLGVETRSFKCKNCGASTTLPPATVATKCPFCASDVVVEAAPNPNLVRPENLIPFQFNLDAANGKFRAWLKGRWLAPGALKRQATLGELKGIYTPFFTFDANAFSRWAGEAGHYYYTTETRTVMVDGKPQTRQEQVQHIRWENRSGNHQGFYNDELVCASQGLHSRLMEKLYPFDLNALAPYRPEFLSGWGAEEYTIDPRACWQEAQKRMYDKEVRACSSLLDGDTQRGLQVNSQWSNQTWKHLLLPVYVASYMFGRKSYHFLINGQSGEVKGEAPLSWAKIAIMVVAGIGVAALIWFGRLRGWF